MKKARITKIKMWNPRKFSEKISKKNPPIKADVTPHHSWWGAKRLMRIVAIKIKFKT
jgi:hypothetical protein